MNRDIIISMAREAGFAAFSTERVLPELERFAELIVKECLVVARQRLFPDHEGDTNMVAHNNAIRCFCGDIKEHFGVGE